MCRVRQIFHEILCGSTLLITPEKRQDCVTRLTSDVRVPKESQNANLKASFRRMKDVCDLLRKEKSGDAWKIISEKFYFASHFKKDSEGLKTPSS